MKKSIMHMKVFVVERGWPWYPTSYFAAKILVILFRIFTFFSI